jgi:hypothetical protein
MNEIPDPQMFHLITDEKLMAVSDNTDSTEIVVDNLYKDSIETYKCGQCGRLIVFWDSNGKPKFYTPEQ